MGDEKDDGAGTAPEGQGQAQPTVDVAEPESAPPQFELVVRSDTSRAEVPRLIETGGEPRDQAPPEPPPPAPPQPEPPPFEDVITEVDVPERGADRSES